ncbi:MSMEG_1061 family FMN-dependent PPOX-type flavoprotein [Maritalea porphyrae]|uniref:MSMEG_1061 family FMN-dependent PPOX-type flavoprotein n=1 Tax=Maritalea porphyrae TaxID=880732 RepID=UPI0022B03D49|nr:MSMEG_1061 family FMN-dependent PPOX-type flavoprotein [Maritalea porphyrae]MCZ4273593.1 pyridoxamine 5'-phosphate oxidase family protein [Maritalea porphyrae]
MGVERPFSNYAIVDEAALRDLFPPTHELAVQKVQCTLDEHSRMFISRSPLIFLGTQDDDGKADVSPRGDPVGFVQVLDEQTLVIPDRPGNNRLDSLSNIIANPSVGVLFVVPGFDDTLRVSGQAHLTNDPELMTSMSFNGREPRIAIIVKIDSVFIHCAKAFRRSKAWHVDQLQDRKEMPSLMKIILDQTGAPVNAGAQQELDDNLEEEYRRSMY